MKTNATLPLLVQFVNDFLGDHDLPRFHRRLTERYEVGTLCRLLQSPDVRSRRSAALALGIFGSPQCDENLVQALRDPDDVVREWSEKSLWMIWFRSADPDHNVQLQHVAELIATDKPAIAVDQATELIREVPHFAEAYNQRAIAYWRLGMFEDAVRDCRKVIELNPQHFGAAAGLGQCLMQRGDRSGAMTFFEKALDINPNLAGVKDVLEKLRDEAGGE